MPGSSPFAVTANPSEEKVTFYYQSWNGPKARSQTGSVPFLGCSVIVFQGDMT